MPNSGHESEPARDYDQMVDWTKRLGREAPFFRTLFDEAGVGRVIDVGCGSGKHAIMFAQWGCSVVGVDPSGSMLAQARDNAAAAGVGEADLRFIEGGFGDLGRLLGGDWDAIVTLGNGLPHVDGIAGLEQALVDFASVLRPGGVLVLHLLNHARLIEGRIRLMPPTLRETPEGDRVFLKVLDYVEDGIMFDFVTITRGPDVGPSPGNAFSYDDPAETGWHLRSRRSVHTAIPVDLLIESLAPAGFDEARAYGDHSGRELDRANDESVIVTARRAGAL